MTVHHIFANKSNIGDWLSARGIQQLLAPLEVVEHYCDEPFVADTLAQLASTTESDLILIGGGGLFMDYFVPFWRGLSDLALRSTICIWGVGCCDIKAEPSLPPMDVVLNIVRASRVCVVRDELTRRYLGADCPRGPVACPSIVVVEPSPGGWGILHVDNYTTAGAQTFEIMDQLCREFAEGTKRCYRRTNNRISQEVELEQVLSLYAASDLVVSSALHGCVIAVAMGKKVCAVSGDYKIEAFMESVGLSEWVLDASEVESLKDLLMILPTQGSVLSCVKTVWSANVAVAEEIKAIAGELALDRENQKY